MSNPSDPKKPTPEQPDPNAQPPQPDDASGGYQSGSPSFEFQLPDEVGSYSELPPIPEPDANDTSGTDFALPPKPEAGRPGVSFDFISLPGSRGSFGDFGMEPLPLPTEDALALPDLPAVPGPGDSAILLDPPALADPATAMFGMAPLTPASLPDISTLYPPLEPAPGILPELPPQDAMADIDLGSESGILLSDDVAAVPVAGDSAVGFAEPLPDAEPVSAVLSVEPAAPDSAPDLGGVPAMPVAGDSSIALDEVEEFAVAEPASSFVMGSDKPASSPSVPDLASLFPAPASSGSTPELPTTAVAAGSSGSTPELPAHQRGGSSFEFQLPDEVGSYSELPPIPEPDANDTSGTDFALPPKPEAGRPGVSFDFISLPGSRGSFGDFGMEPLPLPTEDALALPDLPAVPGPGDSAILLDPPALADPATAMFGMAPLTPASLPDISTLYPPLEPAPGILPELPPQDAMADIDLGSESGILLSDDVAAVPVAGDSAVGFAEPLPDAEPVSAVLSVEPAAPDSAPDLGGVPAMPVAGDSSIALDEVEEFAVAEPASSFVMGSDKPASSPSVPDLASLFPAPASSGSTPELPTTAVAAGSSGSTPELPAHQRGGSSFEFQLPDEVGSYSELPPIPDPDANDTSGTHGALPPKPVARPADASFDFINATGSRSFADIDFAGQVIDAEPIEAEAVPTAEAAAPAGDSKVGLGAAPPVDAVAPASGWLDSDVIVNPPVAAVAGDSAILLESPVLAEPASGTLPEVVSLDAMADIDLGSESGILLSDDVAAAPVAGDSTVGFGGPIPLPDDDLPLAEAAPSSATLHLGDLPVADDEPVSGILEVEPVALDSDSVADLGETLPVPVAGDSAIALDEVEEFAVAEPASSFVMGSDKPASSPSVPDLASLFPAPASSGSTPELPTTAVAAGSSGSTPELPAHQRGGSSFEFQLPDEVGSYSELPPIPDPDANDTSGTHGALPPKPVARPADASFDFINATGSRSFADIDFAGQVIEAEAVPTAELPAADSGIDLGDEAVDAVVVAPASGWLDSAVVAAPIPVAGPSSDPFDDAPAADLIESSDIFSSGPGGTTAELVDGSGVLPPDRPRPTAERAAEPVRPSEVALTFNDPPGGSTVQDGDLSDLPVADEFADSGTMMLSSPAGDDESIHDQLALTSDNPLFDSATLADSPDLPADPDAAEFGVASDNTSDASSILADLTEPYEADGDSSSVRVEAPGLDRTLTGGPSDASFDLTVSDEPIPAELFDEADDGTLTEATAWQEPSGSGLLGQGQTAAKIDLSDVIEVEDADLADADLFGDLPETSSPPSSIFSGSGPPALSPSARIGGGQPADEMTEDIADAVEFTDRPELEETVTRDLLPPAAPRKRVPNLSSADFELSDAPAPVAAEVDDEGAIDWDAVPDDEDQATRGNPKDASLSAILRGELPDDSDEMSTKNTRPLVPVRYDAESTAEPQVSVDWLAGSAEGSAVEDAVEETEERPVAKGKAKAKKDPSEPKTKAKTDPNRDDQTGTGTRTGTRTGTATAERKTQPAKKGGVVIGLLVGAVVAGGAFAGVYFGGVLPNGDNKGTAKAPTPGPDGKVTIDGKDYVPAKGEAPANPLAAFAAGDTAKALDHFKTNPPKTATDMAASGQIRVFATVQALKDGESVKADDADLKTAREELREVIKPANTAEPGGVKRGVKATVALGVSHEIVGEIDAARKVYQDGKANYPTYASTFEALIDKLDALAPPAEPPPGTSRRLDPADAERILFAVVLLLQGEANPVEDPEPGVHYWKAVNLAAGGKYKEAVEQITEAKKAHAVRARVVAGRGLNPLSDPLEQIFTRSCDELKAYWELRATLYGKPGLVAAIKRDGDLAKALDTLLKAEKDVVDATAMAKKLETDVTNLKKDVTDVTALKKEAEDKLKVTEKNLETTTASLKESERDAKDQGVALAAIVESLKPVAPVPEKWTGADVVRATKAAVARASGPDLRKLVPDAMMAVGGGGLTTGMLLDISDRLTKAEAAAKDATAKLAAETKRLTDKYDTDTKALKDGSAEEIKKLDTKHALDVKKLEDAHAVALKDEQARTDAEKKKAATREIEIQKQLANAVTPGQVMDIWLPTLTDLRRPSDSAPALAAAQKALAGSTTDSEDAAKAKTVAGMAYLLKGDLANAKESFQVARRNPAYAKAPKAFWAQVADEGLEAVDDPIAPYRRPVVVPPVDLKAAAAGLDAGIAAYKTGRYTVAVKALEGAAKNNPADSVAWYFLGATRWAQGDEEQAKKDFAQGAEREKVSVVPNRTLSAALAPIQGATRDVIDRTRP